MEFRYKGESLSAINCTRTTVRCIPERVRCKQPESRTTRLVSKHFNTSVRCSAQFVDNFRENKSCHVGRKTKSLTKTIPSGNGTMVFCSRQHVPTHDPSLNFH